MRRLEVETERVDDILLLMAIQQKMGIGEILDKVIKLHGNRQGLSVSEVLQVWLSYILSEGDHRMVVVEDWASRKLTLLSQLMGKTVRAKDFTDDRLSDVLKELNDDEIWESLETHLGQHMIEVYQLPYGKQKVIRLDSTSVRTVGPNSPL